MLDATRQSVYVLRNTEARSRIIVWVCERALAIARADARKRRNVHVRACRLAYPACNAYAPYYVAICGLSGPTTFFAIIS